MALKSRSYILDLNCVKLSLEIFFFMSRLMESFFTSFQDLPLFSSKNTHQKAANLKFDLILPAAMIIAWFLEGQYIYTLKLYLKGTVTPKSFNL